MFSFSWLLNKNREPTKITVVKKETNMFVEIHKLLVIKAKELNQESLSRNCIIITADKWQEPRNVEHPTDNELITGLIARGLINDCGLDQYEINDSI